MFKPVFVWHEKKLISVNPADVLFLDTKKNYTKIALIDTTIYEIRSSLANALRKFPPEMFVKVGRDFAVSIYHIEKIVQYKLVVAGANIPISKHDYKPLIEQLNVIGMRED